MRSLSRLRTWLDERTGTAAEADFKTLSASDGYSLWADSYPPRPHNSLMEVEQAAVAPLLSLVAPARALDVGTGTGRYLPLLASAGARLVVGVDLSIAMLTRRLATDPCICADARRLPFGDGTFDLVCASLMIGDVQDVAVWLQEASRVLVPGGRLVYSDFHPSWVSNRWRRTFRAGDGRQFEIAYFPHSIDEHLESLERSSLSVQAIREPRIPGLAPVVVVFHAVKPGPPVSSRQKDPGGERWAPTLQGVRLCP
jgi:malonyl-CoA O-methyltransferase